jgi:hypothetical protein
VPDNMLSHLSIDANPISRWLKPRHLNQPLHRTQRPSSSGLEKRTHKARFLESMREHPHPHRRELHSREQRSSRCRGSGERSDRSAESVRAWVSDSRWTWVRYSYSQDGGSCALSARASVLAAVQQTTWLGRTRTGTFGFPDPSESLSPGEPGNSRSRIRAHIGRLGISPVGVLGRCGTKEGADDDNLRETSSYQGSYTVARIDIDISVYDIPSSLGDEARQTSEVHRTSAPNVPGRVAGTSGLAPRCRP